MPLLIPYQHLPNQIEPKSTNHSTQKYAIPYQILPDINPPSSLNDTRIIVEPNLLDEKTVSSVAFARYSGKLYANLDEEITLNDWFTFRMEL